MPLFRLRCGSRSFPFVNLPTDLQVHILSCMDLHTLHATIIAIPHAKTLYLGYPSSILHGATSVMGAQIGNLILTIFRLVQMIHTGIDLFTEEDENITPTVLARLDSEEPQKIPSVEKHALEVLNMLTKFDDEISYFVREYSQDIYNRTCLRDNPGVTPLPPVLSFNERYRMMRAFYRLKLFGVLFYNYADRFKVDLQASYDSFFECLSTFEMDELVTAYQYLVREDMCFDSAFPHDDCSYVSVKPHRDCQDPFNCETCRGHCLGPSNPSSPWWRGVQPFWHTLERRYVDSVGLWANPNVCRDNPVKIWDDVVGPNEPNTGWLVWCTYRGRDCIYGTRTLYVSEFRILGYCFWDRERLEGWGMVRKFGQLQRPENYYQWTTRYEDYWC